MKAKNKDSWEVILVPKHYKDCQAGKMDSLWD